MGSQTEVNVERPPKTAQALSIDCSRQAERAERLSAYITPQPCADCRCMRKTTYAACVAWLIHFPEVGKQSNGCGQRVSSSTSAGHVLRRGRRGALIDPQTSLLGIGTNLSRASGWSRVGTRPTSTASCQQKQTTTMTNSVSPAPWPLRDRFSASEEPHVMA
jgi:hypothetical protein